MPEVMSKKVVAIEYPREDETITSSDYTFRIAAMHGVKDVEISIDESDWRPCRQAGASWWYDWSGYRAGEHGIVARLRLPDGRSYTTDHRFFAVEFDRADRRDEERQTLSPRLTRQLQRRADLHKQMVNKCVVVMPNEPGLMRQLTQLLSHEGVNIDSLLTETVGDVASFRFLLEKENGLRRTLEAEGFHVVDDKVFRLDLRNRPGELDHLTRRLAEQGVSIRYLYGTSHGATTKVILAVDRPEDAVGVVNELDQRRVCVEA